MSKTFSLVDLVAEPLYFRDVLVCSDCAGEGTNKTGGCVRCGGKGKINGDRYEARTTGMFGATDYARYDRMRREFASAFEIMQGKAAGDKATAALVLEEVGNDLLQIVVPALPIDRVKALESGYKFRFLQWWQEQQPQTELPPGEAQPGERVARGRRSPGSAASTPASGQKAS